MEVKWVGGSEICVTINNCVAVTTASREGLHALVKTISKLRICK